MRTRREFLSDLAGTAACVVFGTPGVARAARREVVVGGRRVRVVDGHAHCAVPEVLDVVKGTEFERAVSGSLSGPLVMSPDRVRAMDDQGIDVQVLSINPFWYAADRDLARRIIAIQNARLAALCAARPERFVALASVALQHPDLAVEQLQEAVTTHRMRGAGVGGSVNGEELSSARFDPFWSKAEELGVLVFIHPQGVPEIRSRLQGNGFLTNVIGNPLETTIALSHLIFEGTLDRFPNLKICAAHGGGYSRPTARARIRLRDISGELHQAAQKSAERVFEADVLRFAGVHRRGLASPGGRMRRQPDRAGHRFSLPVDDDRRRPRSGHAGIDRYGEGGHPGREPH